MRLPKPVDSLPAWVRNAPFQTRWAVTSLWRRVRGHHGAFEHGECSQRAALLTDLWGRSWARAEPLGHELRVEYADQWVRFHSLPESKRYAESTAEYDEILWRHRTVLNELQGALDKRLHPWVIATDWDWRDLAAGWSRRQLPDSWPWRSGRQNDDPDAGYSYFWVASELSGPEMDALLLAAADDQGDFVIGAPDLEWLYCPYDGGADVLLPSRTDRDALKARYTDWLPSNAAQL